jgi:hypothetical protein
MTVNSSIFDLRDQLSEAEPTTVKTDVVRQRSTLRRLLKITALVLVLAIIAGAIGGFFYWRHIKTTPQYSLALLIDASRAGNQAEVNELVDTDRVVDSFMPQITSKAIELYGRGVPNLTIQKIAEISAPLIPAVKERARAELPNVIRDRTEQFKSIPFTAMVLGADRYLDIVTEGNTAFVKSKLPDRPFEIKMQKNGERWQVISVTDDELATRIAQRIGQDIIAIASRGNNARTNTLGIQNLNNILRQAEELFK